MLREQLNNFFEEFRSDIARVSKSRFDSKEGLRKRAHDGSRHLKPSLRALYKCDATAGLHEPESLRNRLDFISNIQYVSRSPKQVNHVIEKPRVKVACNPDERLARKFAGMKLPSPGQSMTARQRDHQWLADQTDRIQTLRLNGQHHNRQLGTACEEHLRLLLRRNAPVSHRNTGSRRFHGSLHARDKLGVDKRGVGDEELGRLAFSNRSCPDDGGLRQRQSLSRVPNEDLSRVREFDAPSPALEQLNSEGVLQLLNLAGKGGLREIQFLGGAREVQFVGDGKRRMHLLQLNNWGRAGGSVLVFNCTGNPVRRQSVRTGAGRNTSTERHGVLSPDAARSISEITQREYCIIRYETSIDYTLTLVQFFLAPDLSA